MLINSLRSTSYSGALGLFSAFAAMHNKPKPTLTVYTYDSLPRIGAPVRQLKAFEQQWIVS